MHTLIARVLPVLVLSSVAQVHAGQAISLRWDLGTSSGQPLVPGQPVDLTVRMSNLPSPEFAVRLLAVTIRFESEFLGTTSLPVRGPIVPSVLAAPNDFLAAAAPGITDAAFSTLSNDPAFMITSEGVLFTTTITPIAVGNGTLRVTFADVIAVNRSAPGKPVPLSVKSPAPLAFAVIPSPATAMILVLSIPFAGRRRRM